jgi:hypothetical protein
MFWIDFSWEGIGGVVMLAVVQSLNKDFFAGTVLPSIVDDRALSRPKLKASGIFLHLDNAQPHLASDKYGTFGIKKLSYPPCGLNLAPCDFWLFGYLEHCHDGRFFGDDIALEGVVSEIAMSIEPDMFLRVFPEWKHRLQQCIDQGGDYL